MSGTSIQLHNNFIESTGPLYVTSPDGVINDAQRNKTYSITGLMGGDRGKKKMVQGGRDIRFASIFETGQRTRFHQPGATQNWAQPQKLVHGVAQWRFLITDMSWNLQDVELSLAGVAESDMFDKFVDMKRNYEQVMWTDKWDFMEEHIWSEPDFTEMESVAGGETGKMYSVPAFLNEYPSGLFNSTAGGNPGVAWTTIENIDPTSTVRGQNRFVQNSVSYSNEGTNATGSGPSQASSLMGAFRKAWQKCHFEKPPNHGEYYSNPAYDKQQFFTSPEGQTAFQMFLSQFQDTFVIEGRQDPAFPDPSYNFIPVKYVNALTTATLYPNNTTVASATANIAEGTNATGNKRGPRYYLTNSEYLYPTFHDTYFFLRGKVREHFNDPDTFVVPVRTWGNLICTSRMRHCLISPTGNLYASLYT
jgi:hypothetical protein